MDVYIFRHAASNYRQGMVNLVEANDLTLDGIIDTTNSAADLAKRLEKLSKGALLPVQLSSSPFGRCLHSSKIIDETLTNAGFLAHPIKISNNLGEVGNFEWYLFNALVKGGKIEYEGETFDVNPDLTNPQNLKITRYFRTDSAHKLAWNARQSLPKSCLDRVDTFERYHSVVKRLSSELETILSFDAQIQVICTHEGLTGEFIEQISKSQDAYLNMGMYFGARNEGGIWVPYDCQKGAINY